MVQIWPANDAFLEGASGSYGSAVLGYIGWLPNATDYQPGTLFFPTLPLMSVTARDTNNADTLPVGIARRQEFSANCEVYATLAMSNLTGPVRLDCTRRNGVMARCRGGSIVEDGTTWTRIVGGDCYAFYFLRTDVEKIRFRLSRYNAGVETILEESDELQVTGQTFATRFTLRLIATTDNLSRVNLEGRIEGFQFLTASVAISNVYANLQGQGTAKLASTQITNEVGGQYHVDPIRVGEGPEPVGAPVLTHRDSSPSRITGKGRCGAFLDKERLQGLDFVMTLMSDFAVIDKDSGQEVWHDQGLRSSVLAGRPISNRFGIVSRSAASDWWHDRQGQPSWDHVKNRLASTAAFNTADWTKLSGCTVAANTTTDPEGTTNADRVSGTGAASEIRQSISAANIATNRPWFGTWYIKKDTSNQVRFRVEGTVSGRFTELVIAFSGTVASISSTNQGGAGIHNATLNDEGAGWYKLSCAVTPAGTDGINVRFFPTNAGGSAGVHCWGAGLAEEPLAGAYFAPFFGDDWTIKRDTPDAAKLDRTGDATKTLWCWSQRPADDIRVQHRQLTVSWDSVTPTGQEVALMLRGSGTYNPKPSLAQHFGYILELRPGAIGTARMSLYRRSNGTSDTLLARLVGGSFTLAASTSYLLGLEVYPLDSPVADGPAVLKCFLDGVQQTLVDQSGGQIQIQPDGTIIDNGSNVILSGAMEGFRVTLTSGGTYTVRVDSWTQLALNNANVPFNDHGSIAWPGEKDGAFGTLELAPQWEVERVYAAAIKPARVRFDSDREGALALTVDQRRVYRARALLVGDDPSSVNYYEDVRSFWLAHKGSEIGFAWTPPGLGELPRTFHFRPDVWRAQRLVSAAAHASWVIELELEELL